MSIALKVVIDWNNDGLFTGEHDDITADIKQIDWSLGMGVIYQPIADESTCNIVLENGDGKYLPENVNSPLYPDILPNRRIKIMYTDGVIDTPLWVGWIEFIKPVWAVGPHLRPVVITGTGSKRIMQVQQVSLPIYTDVTGDVIIDDILAQVQPPPAVGGVILLDHPIFGLLPNYLGSPDDYSDVETGLTVIPQYGESGPLTALGAIIDVTAGEQGRFFFDRDGKAVWWNRHHLLNIVADDATVNSASGDNKPTDIEYVYGEDIANIIRITSNPKNIGVAPEIMWQLDVPMTIPPGQTKHIESRLRKENGQFAGSAGLTPNPTFSSGTATVTVSAKGSVANVSIANASPSTPAVLSALSLVGVATTNQNMMDIVETDDESAANYGIKELSVDLGTMGDFAGAENVAKFELARRKDPFGNVLSVMYDRKFDGIDNANLLDWTIGTRLRMVADEFGQDFSYFIINEEHSYDVQKKLRHVARFGLEPANRSDFLILDDPIFGLLDNNRLVY